MIRRGVMPNAGVHGRGGGTNNGSPVWAIYQALLAPRRDWARSPFVRMPAATAGFLAVFLIFFLDTGLALLNLLLLRARRASPFLSGCQPFFLLDLSCRSLVAALGRRERIADRNLACQKIIDHLAD